MQNKILCSISTKGRYHTTLPLAIQSIITQTYKVDKLVIFDDNDDPKDLRSDPIYMHLFKMLDIKGISWEWLFAGKKGQHHNHQIANMMGYEFVWRLDDDTIAEPDVLQNLLLHMSDDVGAVGGSILTPNWDCRENNATGLIDNIDKEPNIQWGVIKDVKDVDHLHCSFLYRAGIVDYNTGLSKVAHREETLFTFNLKRKGYKILVIPETITWHLKSPDGGIRTHHKKEMYDHDEFIFRNHLKYRSKNIIVLDCGMGDHVVFKKVMENISNPLVFTCYPQIIDGESISEAKRLFGDIDCHNIYKKMEQWNWKDSLENAFRKLYL